MISRREFLIGLLMIGNRFQEALILKIAAATDFHKQLPSIYCDRAGRLPSTGGPALPFTGDPVDTLWSSLLKAIEAIFKLWEANAR